MARRKVRQAQATGRAEGFGKRGQARPETAAGPARGGSPPISEERCAALGRLMVILPAFSAAYLTELAYQIEKQLEPPTPHLRVVRPPPAEAVPEQCPVRPTPAPVFLFERGAGGSGREPKRGRAEPSEAG